MKNLKFILVLAISMIAISCGSDDDGGPAEPTLTNELLAGTYDLNFLQAEAVITQSVTGGVVTTTIRSVGSTFGDSNIVFTANGTYTSDYQYVLTTTTTLEGNDPVVETDIVTDTETGTYSVNDTNQTITVDGITGDVTLFNSNSLRVVSEETEVVGDASSILTSEARFSRQ